MRFSDLLGNVTFLERPFHPTTFISVARTALKTRQRQHEARARMEELHEGEERLRTALLAGRLGTWELDSRTWTLSASAAIKALFGRTPDQPFAYEDLLQSTHPDDRARIRECMIATIETGADYAAEYRIVWPDGSMHWAEIRARLVRDRASKNARLVGVCSDITDRKTNEQALRRLNETLEQRVTERTSELRPPTRPRYRRSNSDSVRKSGFVKPRKWRRSANSLAGWRMTSTTCLWRCLATSSS